MLPSNPTTLRETDAIDALELGARRMDFIGEKFQLADEMADRVLAAAKADEMSKDRKTHARAAHEMGDINGA